MTKLFQSNYQIQNYVKWHIIFSFVKWHLSIIQIHTIQIQIVLSYYKLYIFGDSALKMDTIHPQNQKKTENTHREKLNCILQNIHNAKWSCSHTHTHTHTQKKPQEEDEMLPLFPCSGSENHSDVQNLQQTHLQKSCRLLCLLPSVHWLKKQDCKRWDHQLLETPNSMSVIPKRTVHKENRTCLTKWSMLKE